MGLGKVLTEIREKKKLTRLEAAQRIGISRTYLREIEVELKVPTIATLRDITGTYDTKLYKVFKELDA